MEKKVAKKSCIHWETALQENFLKWFQIWTTFLQKSIQAFFVFFGIVILNISVCV